MANTSTDERLTRAGASARQGVDKLVDDVEKVQSDMKALSDKVAQLAGESLTRAQEGAAEGLHQAGEAVKRNPFSALAIAIGVGLLLGVALRR